MERQEINEKLAIQIMGWHLESCPCGSCNVKYWVKDKESNTLYFKDWNPFENIEQAFMCLHKWLEDKSYHLNLATIFNTKLIKIIRCTLYVGTYYSGDSDENGSEAQAICNCLLNAIGKAE